ncbi:FOG: TPR repeat [uncultured Candidatus Thioglobus sp.]|nr:FOG: TPR repeat [uncultured Candidatus Thioglobus sp.]
MNKSRKIPTINFKFSDLFTAEYRLTTALLILLPLIVYLQVYDFGFVWDDDDNISKGHLYNPFVLNPSWTSFEQLLSQPYFGMYIPINYFFLGVLKSFAELLLIPVNSFLHLSNVAVHIVNGLLVFTLLKQFVINKWAVLVGVLFFLLHPIQVETVAWVGESRSLLAFCFVLTALYFYLKNQTRLSFLSLFLFVLALLSKPSAVVLVPFVFLINYFHYGFKLSKNIEKTLLFALIALLFITLAQLVQSQYHLGIFDYTIDIWQRPFAWLDSIVFYVIKLIYPYHLSASYTLSPQFIAQQWWFYPLALLPLGLGYLLWLKRKSYPILVFATLLFVAGFFTTSGLMSFGFQKYSLVADRYLYFAMVGVALLIAVIFSKTDKIIKQGLIIMILLIFTALSAFRQIPIWQSALKLWTHSVKYELSVQYAHESLAAVINNQGVALYRAGKSQQALVYFNKAIKIFPEEYHSTKKFLSDPFANRGASLLIQKEYSKALSDFNQALKIDPSHFWANTHKINTLLKLKQCDQAHTAVSFARKNQVKLKKTALADLRKNCANNT